jgi:hypothetical protein
MVLIALAEIAVETSWWALKQSYNLGYYMVYGSTESKEDKILNHIEELRKINELERIELNEIRAENRIMREIYKRMIESGEIITIEHKNNKNKKITKNGDDKYKKRSLFDNEDNVKMLTYNIPSKDEDPHNNQDSVNILDMDFDSIDVINEDNNGGEEEDNNSGEEEDNNGSEEEDNSLNQKQDEFIYNYYKNILNK